MRKVTKQVMAVGIAIALAATSRANDHASSKCSQEDSS